VAKSRDERRFIRRLRCRDEAAFTELVRLHQDHVFSIVYRMLGDREEARDVAQEVFVTVFRRIDSFREEAGLSTWLYRVAVNHCKNRIRYLRRRGGGRNRSVDDLTDADWANVAAVSGGPAATGLTVPPLPDEVLVARRLAARLQARLDALDPDLRALIVLRDIEGLSYAEISEVTAQPLGTVKSRIHRARMALRDPAEFGQGGEGSS
jgi:RNA polymerase sigma-70 factor (ECF subfamily)